MEKEKQTNKKSEDLMKMDNLLGNSTSQAQAKFSPSIHNQTPHFSARRLIVQLFRYLESLRLNILWAPLLMSCFRVVSESIIIK